MTKRSMIPWLWAAMAALMLVVPAVEVRADALADARARMGQRLTTVVDLWRQGKVGENNLGFLAPRGPMTAEERAIVDAENADRRVVYAELAARSNLKPEEVGRAQARKIAQASPKGYWIQDEEGDWARKS